jgi:hypothetical protein
MLAHLRTFLDQDYTLREMALLYYLATQPAPIGHSDIVQGLCVPDSAGSIRALIDGPVALGVIEKIAAKNRRGKMCWLYAITPKGRRTLRLPTKNHEPRTTN